MSSFFSDPEVGGNGTTTTDDRDPLTGLDAGGWKTRFIPALAQVVAIGTWVKNRALQVAGYVTAASESAEDAAGSAGTALDFSVIADTEADRATTQADRAWAEANRAEIAAGSVDPTEISDIDGLQDALDSKAPATATTTALNLKAPLASPVFTGNPTAPTPALGDNDTTIPTTAFVQATVALAAPPPSVRTITAAASVATTDNKALLVLNGASAFTLSLPAVASVPAGFSVNVKNIAAVGVGTVTIDPNGAELIAGRATIPVYGGEEGFTIQSTGTAWQCLGRAKEVVVSLIAVGTAAQVDVEAPFVDPEMRAVQIDMRSLASATGVGFEARFKIAGSYTSYNGYYWGGATGGSGPVGYNLQAATFGPSNGSATQCSVTGRMAISCGPGVEPSLQFVGARWDFSFAGYNITAGWSVRNGALSPGGIRLSPASGNFAGGDLQVVGIRA